MNDIFHQWLMNFGCFIFGLVAGATAMIYVYEQPKATKPVVTVEQDGASAGQPSGVRRTGHDPIRPQQARDAAPPLAQAKADIEAKFARIDQRLDELTFAARKLAGVKQTWDVRMGEVGK